MDKNGSRIPMIVGTSQVFLDDFSEAFAPRVDLQKVKYPLVNVYITMERSTIFNG